MKVSHCHFGEVSDKKWENWDSKISPAGTGLERKYSLFYSDNQLKA